MLRSVKQLRKPGIASIGGRAAAARITIRRMYDCAPVANDAAVFIRTKLTRQTVTDSTSAGTAFFPTSYLRSSVVERNRYVLGGSEGGGSVLVEGAGSDSGGADLKDRRIKPTPPNSNTNIIRVLNREVGRN